MEKRISDRLIRTVEQRKDFSDKDFSVCGTQTTRGYGYSNTSPRSRSFKKVHGFRN